MQHSNEMRRCLEDLDVAGIRRLWNHVAPHQPVPTKDEHVLVAAHHARTQAESMPLKARAYSHQWLSERGFPSALPDRLKPAAVRLYPVIAAAVGISVNTKSEIFKPAIPLIRGAMERAVLECYADGHKDDPAIIKSRMMEAKTTAARQLLGI